MTTVNDQANDLLAKQLEELSFAQETIEDTKRSLKARLGQIDEVAEKVVNSIVSGNQEMARNLHFQHEAWLRDAKLLLQVATNSSIEDAKKATSNIAAAALKDGMKDALASLKDELKTEASKIHATSNDLRESADHLPATIELCKKQLEDEVKRFREMNRRMRFGAIKMFVTAFLGGVFALVTVPTARTMVQIYSEKMAENSVEISVQQPQEAIAEVVTPAPARHKKRGSGVNFKQ